MEIEWEAKFLNIDKDEVRKRLVDNGFSLVKPEALTVRNVYMFPLGHERESSWIRVRDEGGRVTLSVKTVVNGIIDAQNEVLVEVNNFKKTQEILELIGCKEKAYQETKREIWEGMGVEVCIDEWPYLEPLVEIEGKDEESVKGVSNLLGFDYSQAVFGSNDQTLSAKYGIPVDAINNEINRIVFSEPNPYLAWKEKNLSTDKK